MLTNNWLVISSNWWQMRAMGILVCFKNCIRATEIQWQILLLCAHSFYHVYMYIYKKNSQIVQTQMINSFL
jgi:predicted DNA-binding transcriptional regulator